MTGCRQAAARTMTHPDMQALRVEGVLCAWKESKPIIANPVGATAHPFSNPPRIFRRRQLPQRGDGTRGHARGRLSLFVMRDRREFSG